MNVLKITSQFKKDLKRYKHKKSLIDKLDLILKKLVVGEEIPEENRPHPLTGNYRGHMECHIESDTLLIWWDKESGVIKLVRLGSHSELF
ncbi:MAG: type II toxin-antitoxin system YafQ family toxin [Muribaculaceae bacterium]|nr:type II toxin-antitoxin system YafQ family toxin [Muribaculaceae bacterium]